MFVDASEAFYRLRGLSDLELLWDEGAGRVVVTIRLGAAANRRDDLAAAISAANSDLGLVGFRFDGDEVVFSLSAFLDPDQRISAAVLSRLISTGRRAVESWAGRGGSGS